MGKPSEEPTTAPEAREFSTRKIETADALLAFLKINTGHTITIDVPNTEQVFKVVEQSMTHDVICAKMEAGQSSLASMSDIFEVGTLERTDQYSFELKGDLLNLSEFETFIKQNAGQTITIHVASTAKTFEVFFPTNGAVVICNEIKKGERSRKAFNPFSDLAGESFIKTGKFEFKAAGPLVVKTDVMAAIGNIDRDKDL